VQPFPKTTALENVMARLLFAGGSQSAAAACKHALECLDFCNLADMADGSASSLTLPTRKRLEVAKALATRPGAGKATMLRTLSAMIRPTAGRILLAGEEPQ
jgi:branched-chain amino acid transport system ATP-binding protein